MDSELKIPDVFMPLIGSTRTEFNDLVTTYRFQLTTEQAIGPEAWVTFENATTRITIHYELGGAPWVEIGRLKQRNGRLMPTSQIGLDIVLRDKGRSLLDDFDSPRDVTENEMSAMLRIRGSLLVEVGDELLRGNFQSFPRLMSKAEKELRRREVELFGSKTEK